MVALERRQQLTLHPDAAIRLLIRSERAARREPGYGGYIVFRTGRPGAYRILLDDRAWVELIAEAASAVPVASHSEHRLRCAGVVKNLSFELAGNSLYRIQLSGAGSAMLNLMVAAPAD